MKRVVTLTAECPSYSTGHTAALRECGVATAWVQASFLVVYGGIFGFMVYFPQYLCVMYLINQVRAPLTARLTRLEACQNPSTHWALGGARAQRERASYYKSVRWGAMAVFSTLVLTAAPIMVRLFAFPLSILEGARAPTTAT